MTISQKDHGLSFGQRLLAAIVSAALLTSTTGVAAVEPRDGGAKSSAPAAAPAAALGCTDQDSAASTITIRCGEARITMWNDKAADGRVHAMYRFSVDGRESGRALEATNQVRLRSADFDPLELVPPVPPALEATPAVEVAAATERVYIVQFMVPPLEDMLEQVRGVGGRPLIFLPDQSQLVRMTPAARQMVAAMPTVRWIGDYHPAYKLDQSLIVPLTTDPDQLPWQRYSIEVFERGPAAQQIVADHITAMGGTVQAVSPKGFRMQAFLTGPQLLEVVRMTQVQFVHVMGEAGEDMDIARQIGGATPLLSGLGFTGQGVRGEVMDSGIRQTHAAFASPAPLVHGIAPSLTAHGTSTFGCVFGNGAGNAAGTGLLPNREQGIFADYDQLISLGGTVDRYDHTEELVDPAEPYRVVFQSNSWGNAWTTQYDTLSAEMDDILFKTDLLDCQSQSNTGNQASRPEAWAKNAVSIGGIAHLNTLGRTDDNWTGASIGPAADGRVKPDLAHFYDSVLCPTSTSDTAYATGFNGTSAATPIVAGHFGLFFQMWHQQVFAGFGGGSSVFESRAHLSTAKAMMINSAFRYNWLVGGANSDLTREHQGWGMPDIGKMFNDRARTFIVNEIDLLLPGGVRTYQVNLSAAQPDFRATLVYTDPKGNTASSVHRINDLSLQVITPDNVTFWGNRGLLAGNTSVPGGAANTIDTVENVFLENPRAGVWTINVFGDVIVQDSHIETPEVDADFALVVVGGTQVIPCAGDVTSNGTVDIDDLVAVITNWGATSGPADVNDDGIVNIDDMVAVITDWGACP